MLSGGYIQGLVALAVIRARIYNIVGPVFGADAARRDAIRNITIDGLEYFPNAMRSVRVSPAGAVESVPLLATTLLGNSSSHGVEGVAFRRVVIGGKRALALADLNGTVNEWVRGVTFE